MEKDREDQQPQNISPERIAWIIQQLIRIDKDEDSNDMQEPEMGHSHNEEDK